LDVAKLQYRKLKDGGSVTTSSCEKRKNKRYYISPVLLHFGLLKATENGAVIISEQEPVARMFLQGGNKSNLFQHLYAEATNYQSD